MQSSKSFRVDDFIAGWIGGELQLVLFNRFVAPSFKINPVLCWNKRVHRVHS